MIVIFLGKTMFNTELPIIQAPMAGVQDHRLTVAVSEAGGLGSLPCGMLSAEQVSSELTLIQQQTDKPYNVNFFCHSMPGPNPERDNDWVNSLQPYYDELGVDHSKKNNAPLRLPFSSEMLDVLGVFKPPVVSFHFGLPETKLLDGVRAIGAKILSSATTVEEALWLEAQGIDGIIVQGIEAGGHRGIFLHSDVATQLGTFALLPQIVDAVKVPVIAAGGIADSRGVKAAINLGASAVQVGTSYLLCDELMTSDLHKKALKAETGRTTAVTNLFSGKPARGIVNRFMSERGPMSEQVPSFPYAAAALTALKTNAEKLGKTDFTPLWSGQNNTGCKEVGAAEMTRSLGDLS